MILWLRTLAFNCVFYAFTVAIVVSVPLVALAGPDALRRHAELWARVQGVLARLLLDVHVRVEGEVPAGPILFAAKHQAMFETLELAWRIGAPMIVMKRELTRIPLWGWAARRYGSIGIDRAAGAEALRAMLREAKAARTTGRAVLIFPEGTRVLPGETPPLRSGFAGLYKALGMPVVPVALDSGRLWPRKGVRRPGTITLRFGAPIPPGLPRAEIEARVHAGINALEPAAADETVQIPAYQS
ncbi:lysophospholipid acyltransferase family protein [Sphingomonas sp. ac-8]|uniref:lysophospholipid acyltransferase family protein n=1 Tax=Sphingomonas sp. ac-8 TaxID=3242977 RepID=UPI003A807F84